MMSTERRVLDWIDDHREEMIDFLLEFGNISSPRGYEREASDFLYDWFDGHDFDVRTQHVAENRKNVVATVPGEGDGGGESLLYNGHLDTAFGNPNEDRWTQSVDLRANREAWHEDGYLVGDDIVNDKGPLTAFVWAGLALQELGVPLSRELLLTASVGEIGGTTVDDWQDPRYLGGGIGTRRLVDGGVTADYAVVAECSNYGVARVEPGVTWLKVEISADAAYQPYVALSDPESVGEDHPGAIPKLARVIFELESWAVEYAEENVVEYDHGTVTPTAGVGAVKSGNPFDPDKSPGYATLYLDVRLPPDEGPGHVRRTVQTLLEDADVDANVTPYFFRRGYVADPDRVTSLVDSIAEAHDDVIGGRPPRPPTNITSMWRDSNVFNEAGIPAVNFGPPRVQPDGSAAVGKALALHEDDFVRTAKLYALTALSVCDYAAGE